MTAQSVKSNQEHLLIVEDDAGRKGITLKAASYTIGRGQNSDIQLASQFVSRHHATLLRKLGADGTPYYRIVDGDGQGKTSVNGLLINGHKKEAHDLKHGDEVVFGPQVFAIYQLRQCDVFPMASSEDPYDITLIDPAMMLEGED
ncbi:FHA domain-containing protein [Oscillatoria sp. FACHB-1406]|uniref:FHA domain-containing protein n=1 Tax=Oscillatoria sp. FACHB-1406 TaxID=2692846 RepID=UPI001685D4E6|nr:FHA domain-containing protein [Oscillatoria sp. FACHB-1406]MBD2576813.1 FHA domain-containing protein [Oscillatoria sp. FACHB-1406]